MVYWRTWQGSTVGDSKAKKKIPDGWKDGHKWYGTAIYQLRNTVQVGLTTSSAFVDASPRPGFASYWRGHQAPLGVPSRSARVALRT